MKKTKKQKNSVVGKITVHADGYGFVLSENKDSDLFIPPGSTLDAVSGDRVKAEVTREENQKGKKRREGKVVEILERGSSKVIGQFEKTEGGYFVRSEQKKQTLRIRIPSAKTLKAIPGQTVQVEIFQYPEKNIPLLGQVIRVFGERGSFKIETEITLAQYELSSDFPPSVIQETKKFKSKFAKEEIAGRVDLRKVPIVTIDGENARDFDDGIFVQKTRSGFKLLVAIADVSHYVQPGSELDAEALSRGTSVYFPDRCIPMLPERLSNDLCSLRPKEDRLAFTAEIHFDKSGKPMRSEFYQSIIRSHARLTYRQVKQMMIDGDVLLREKHADLVPHLKVAFELFEKLREQRMGRGSIDFDLPEPEFVLDAEEGIATSIVKAPRTPAHMLIEEFMIAANEAVGRFMEAKKLPMIYRVHDAPNPEKIFDFSLLAHNLGYKLPKPEKIKAKDLAGLVQSVRGEPQERLINTLLLRSLKQAVYSTENVGHFGLASTSYTHFTSPIRRYPDLIVHRLLAQALVPRKGKKKEKSVDQALEVLQEVASHCSKRERVAMEAEWQMRDLQVALFMKDKLGEVYEGVISSVTKFGFFVELFPFFVEGLVHLNTLRDDRYLFDEKHHELKGSRTGLKFRIGDTLRIQVVKVDIERRRVDFIKVE